MSTSCPSTLALERYLAGSPDDGHIASCASCQQRLASMRSAAASYSKQPASIAARAAFVSADRAWKQKAAALVVVPMLALIVAAVVVARPVTSESQPIAQLPSPSPSKSTPRHAREPVEVRPTRAATVLRTISLAGQHLAVGQGTLEGAEGDAAPKPFVLNHTDVQIDVLGFVSTVVVTQEFANPFSTPVEAIYVFPLPEDAAVDDMTLTAGTRVIRASIEKRGEARRHYEEAKLQGRHAALLDQERPNIFTQSVANLMPHEHVKITLRYQAAVRFDDGEFTLNFPMVVGPRYIAGMATADAARITPPTERPGRDVSVTVNLDAAFPIEGLWSGSHRLLAERASASKAVVTLEPGDRVPNRDFVLSWAVAGQDKRAAVVASGGPGGTFALLVSPEVHAERAALAKEMVFVIDTSCSMSGPPLEAAKQAMTLALTQMNPADTFMLIDFADSASAFSPTPLPNTPENVQNALNYLKNLPAGGGTNQLAGIAAALRRPSDPRRLRVVLLMTDGFIGDDDEVFAEAVRDLGEARLFGFGVGTSVNHHLLRRLSEEGRGFYQYLDPKDDARPAIERFVRRIRRPLLTNLEVDFGSMQAFDLVPARIPDLFDAQPLIVLGRAKQAGHSVITVRGLLGTERYEQRFEVDLPETDSGNRGLSAMWARAKIEALSRKAPDLDTIAQITTLGLEHRLVTQWTSLVAVDSEPVNAAPETSTTVAAQDGSRLAVVNDGDDFESAFGASTHRRLLEVSRVPPPKHPTYIPPAPGSGGDLKESLATSDILETIVASKAALSKCVEEQHRQDRSLTGKLVLKWTIGIDGRVLKVEVVSEDFKDTYVATCIAGVIKTLHFPPHRMAGEPVTFPFKF